MADFKVRLCKISQCLTRVPVPRIFCSRHWALVPSKLQMDIADTWDTDDAEGLEALLRRANNAVITAERKAGGRILA